jgi:hypothetical protein
MYKRPMIKISTQSKKTDKSSGKKKFENRQQLQPSSATLQNILQFASSYRVQQITQNQSVEWYLN